MKKFDGRAHIDFIVKLNYTIVDLDIATATVE